ncbi:MAG: amidohydrolase [Bacteroidetes bacterium CG12_big_fil_rev_8_21_14_0_65_60_17]|nr:MAG: amidohydrolase [Bacteroidetes bacterium CG12_big_fil_rev_8_21_14_0_65_60_17]
MKSLTATIVPFLLLFSACQTGPAGSELADTRDEYPSFLLTDAYIHTGNPNQPDASAMAVVEGRIEAVGTAELLLETHADLPVLSAGGKTVIPGLIDAHAHLRNLAQMRLSADLVGTGSIEEIIMRLKEHEKNLSPGEWLRGRGWDQNDWPTPAFPTRHDLDVAFPDRPVWLERIDGHAMWANTVAIRAASDDLLRSAEAPPGGQLFRLEDGSASGVFIDDAEHLVGVAVPPFNGEALDRGLERALEEAARYGLTGVHEAGVDTSDINRFIRFADQGLLTLRVNAMVEPGPAFDRYCNDHYAREDDLLSIRSVKIYLDGALGSRGAALMQEYSDDPGNHGLMRTAPADYADLVERALECGYQMNTHAIGDSANRLLLDTYEAAGISPDERHRNEHAQVLALDDIERFATLGIIASMQPTHATSDMYWAEDRLGPHRIKGAYAWRSLLDSGARLAFGSDFPVEQVNPMLGFHAALTRQDDQLWPEGGWYPDERLDREEILHAFTLGAAWSGFQDNITGSLEPGKWADFVVLDQDIMTVAPPAILDTRVEATFLAGRTVHGSLTP